MRASHEPSLAISLSRSSLPHSAGASAVIEKLRGRLNVPSATVSSNANVPSPAVGIG